MQEKVTTCNCKAVHTVTCKFYGCFQTSIKFWVSPMSHWKLMINWWSHCSTSPWKNFRLFLLGTSFVFTELRWAKFLTDLKNVSLCNDQWWADRPACQLASCPACHKNFSVVIFMDTVDVINVRLCIMTLLIKFYLFWALSVTLTINEATAVTNSFNWKFCGLIWLSWNFVVLLSTATRSWI